MSELSVTAAVMALLAFLVVIVLDLDLQTRLTLLPAAS